MKLGQLVPSMRSVLTVSMLSAVLAAISCGGGQTNPRLFSTDGVQAATHHVATQRNTAQRNAISLHGDAMMIPSRRRFLLGAGALLAAPSIVRASSLMPVSVIDPQAIWTPYGGAMTATELNGLTRAFTAEWLRATWIAAWDGSAARIGPLPA